MLVLQTHPNPFSQLQTCPLLIGSDPAGQRTQSLGVVAPSLLIVPLGHATQLPSVYRYVPLTQVQKVDPLCDVEFPGQSRHRPPKLMYVPSSQEHWVDPGREVDPLGQEVQEELSEGSDE